MCYSFSFFFFFFFFFPFFFFNGVSVMQLLVCGEVVSREVGRGVYCRGTNHI